MFEPAQEIIKFDASADDLRASSLSERLKLVSGEARVPINRISLRGISLRKISFSKASLTKVNVSRVNQRQTFNSMQRNCPDKITCYSCCIVARDLALVARWRNGSASDPRSEGWGLESLSGQICARLFTVAAYHFFLYSTAP